MSVGDTNRARQRRSFVIQLKVRLKLKLRTEHPQQKYICPLHFISKLFHKPTVPLSKMMLVGFHMPDADPADHADQIFACINASHTEAKPIQEARRSRQDHGTHAKLVEDASAHDVCVLVGVRLSSALFQGWGNAEIWRTRALVRA